jgi:hypothetical protein
VGGWGGGGGGQKVISQIISPVATVFTLVIEFMLSAPLHTSHVLVSYIYVENRVCPKCVQSTKIMGNKQTVFTEEQLDNYAVNYFLSNIQL